MRETRASFCSIQDHASRETIWLYFGIFPLTSLTLVLSLSVSLAVRFLAALLPAGHTAQVNVVKALPRAEEVPARGLSKDKFFPISL